MVEDYINIIEEGITGENSLPNKLRNQKFFDKAAYEKVIKATEQLIKHYKEEELVPKRLCLCFVDISNHFFVDEKYFKEDEINEIEDAGMKLSELGNELFS